MAIDQAVISDDERRLIDNVEHCERRIMRSNQRFALAQAERDDAIGALATARERLDAWHETNPYQPSLALEG